MKLIELTRGKYTLVDDGDYEYLSQWSWYAINPDLDLWYAVRGGKDLLGKTCLFYMHREITQAGKGMKVDHKDGDGLNNRRYNLRVCESLGNNKNRKRNVKTASGYKGVHSSGEKWVARIQVDKSKIYIGVFDSPEEAAKAYDVYAKMYHGEYARLNFS